MLTRLADTMERNKDLRESVKSAMIYPTILIFVAVVLGIERAAIDEYLAARRVPARHLRVVRANADPAPLSEFMNGSFVPVVLGAYAARLVEMDAAIAGLALAAAGEEALPPAPARPAPAHAAPTLRGRSAYSERLHGGPPE